MSYRNKHKPPIEVPQDWKVLVHSHLARMLKKGLAVDESLWQATK